MTTQPAAPTGHAFARVLGRADLALFSVSAVLTMDTLASAASMGFSWFAWWALTLVLFFLPYGLMTAEMGAAWPGEGGLYVWVREALGTRAGSLAAWFYWINNAYWTASVYMAFGATFHAIFLKGQVGAALREGPAATWLQAGIAVSLTWATVAVGVVRLDVSKWLPSLGAVVKAAVFLGLGALGLLSVVSGRPSANAFSLVDLVPRWGASLVFLPVLLYNAMGFELMSAAGDEMKDPQRDVPRATLLAGLFVAVLYTFGILGILLAVPLSKLSLATGTWDALEVLGRQWGSAGDTLVLALGVGFLYACVANVVTWSLGVNRVAAAAAAQGAAPAALGRLHRRFDTPYMAFVIQGVVASALLLGNALLSSRTDNVFWMVFKLSGVCFLVPYLLAFPAFVILRYQRSARPRPYRMPGGMPAAWAAGIVTTAFVAGAILLFFRPAPTAEDPAAAMRETWVLLAESLATLAVGLVFVWRMPGTRRRA
jgi:amino acid transporter